MKKKYKTLSVDGALLSQCQLEAYMKKIASDHILTDKSQRKTFPVPRLKDNLKFIYGVYNILNEDLKNNLPIHPAGEWLLDNYYIIEKNAKIIIKDLNVKKYVSLLGIANSLNNGFARAFVIAKEIVSYTDGKIDGDSIEAYLNAYQSKKTLSMDELWSIVTFLQIALIEKIRGICEKIYLSQIQKRKVEDIVTRLVEFKESNVQINNERIQDTSESKYPFIEYMSYRLKKYGKNAYEYLEILEEQTKRMGTSIIECINREHYDMAAKKVSIGNSINSMNLLNRLNYVEIFDRVNGVEDELRKDPAGVYEKMDYETKEYYRRAIENLSKKTKISELYIAKKCVEMASSCVKDDAVSNKKSHVGYYLIDNGKKDLLLAIGSRSIKKSKQNPTVFIVGNIFFSFVTAVIMSVYVELKYESFLITSSCFFLFWILNWVFFERIIQYISGKIIQPRLIPKLDFTNGIPNDSATMVVIPTILDSEEKVTDIFKKLEVYYMANRSDNIFFTLLGDCTSNLSKSSDLDEKIVNMGVSQIESLNAKYRLNQRVIFNFIYRKRAWSDSEQCYLGWERKRGLLTQFNDYLLNQTSDLFLYNSFEALKEEVPKIKYIITLDCDTSLALNSGVELVGAMSHILNRPEIDNETNTVVGGYGIIQPRVGINIDEGGKSNFSKLFSGVCGVDSYSNAISDFYQDNFEEGIYTGKGIYDLQCFSKVLNSEIPENKVLSHDLLEGCYLKCGLASDVVLMDGYPSTYLSYRMRAHRWIRGDYQILGWIKSKKLSRISKFKILDNIIRSWQEIVSFILFIGGLIAKSGIIVGLALVPILLPYILEGFNKIIARKNGQIFQKKYNKQLTGYGAIISRAFIDFILIPDKAYTSLNAMCKALYRMCISKKKMLQWVTSEEADKNTSNGLVNYYKCMFSNVIAGVTLLFIGRLFALIVGILWISGPLILYYLGKTIKRRSARSVLNNEEERFICDVGSRTWQFFKTYLNLENNYLPPDNYQEDRKNKIVQRTSPTNIGLALLSVITSYDMKFESKEYVIDLLEKMIYTVEKLPKWNGHLYNWYDISTLTPLFPRYISSVDSGNFVGYLYVLKSFLLNECRDMEHSKIESMVDRVSSIIEETDFAKLFDDKTGLFSIGYNIEENKMTDSYYDLLASEARQASLVAIAKKDVSAKHWKNLGRSLTTLNKYKGLISWSGTAFEYLMPTINIKRYEGSLLDESCKFMIMSQIEYARKLGIVWGISEAAFNLKDFKGNYQYKAFGVPWLGLKRGLTDDVVVSSYGAVLAINDIPKETIQNLKTMESMGMYDKFGYYESVDYTPSRARNKKKYAVVKTYMAHHQGLILLSINNLINEDILQKRFFENPEIAGIDILLQERMPDNVIITKEKKEHIEKIKYVNYDYYLERSVDKNSKEYNAIYNNDYTILVRNDGTGYSKYKDKLINRFKPTDIDNHGIDFWIKDTENGDIWETMNSKNVQNVKTFFYPDRSTFYCEKDELKMELNTFIAPDESMEIRCLNLKNIGNKYRKFEVSSIFEPVLSTFAEDIAHKAFSKLFLKFEKEENCIVVKRSNKNEDNLYMAVSLFDGDNKNLLEFGVDKEMVYGRNNYGIPDSVKESRPFGNEVLLTPNPIIALRKSIRIEAGEEKNVVLLVGVSEEKEKAIQSVSKYCNMQQIARAQKLSRAQIEAKIQYLGFTGKRINLYQRILSHLLNPCVRKITEFEKLYPTEELWKFGVSGDNPILLAKISNISEIDIVKNIVQFHEFVKLQNLKIDVIIENDEPESYENYLQNTINEIVWNSANDENGGVFVLKNTTKDDQELLLYRADLVIDGKFGKIDYLLDEIDSERSEAPISSAKYKKINQDDNHILNMNELKFFNEYGGFSQDGDEYVICINKDKKLPAAWSNIIANEKFGTVVNENMGGYSWYKNARLNRITCWCNDPVCDVPSEVLYISDCQSNKVWTPALVGQNDENEFYVKYGKGYATYMHSCEGIEQRICMFVPQNDASKIYSIQLKNLAPEKRALRITFYMKLALDEDETKSHRFIRYKKDDFSNAIFLKNQVNTQFNFYTVISSSEKITSFTGKRALFFGEESIDSPAGILQNYFDNMSEGSCEGFIAVNMTVEIEAFEQKEISIFYGCSDERAECIDLVNKYKNIDYCKKALEDVRKFWANLLGKIAVKTPEESLDILANGWLMYQAYCSRMLAKTGYYQSGGAWGFRDQLQDAMCMKYSDISITKNQIIKHSKHQFEEGDVLHWWHDETGRGVRTRFSDDLLWLVYVVCDYIDFSGDYEILDVKTPYLHGAVLDDGVDECYDFYAQSNVVESIYNHCIRAIDKALDFGKHGIPKIGSGDWNDGFNTVGNRGIGESVWLGFFLYDILMKFQKVCDYKNDTERKEKYARVSDELKEALNENCWDGRWFNRAYCDDGAVIGSIRNNECKIDGISQSWAIISGASDDDKKCIAMESMENYLVDREKGIIKLLTPPFENGEINPGYIKLYLPGTRENGGQYTHGAVWSIIAEAIMKNENRAMEYLKMIGPIYHSKSKEAADVYKLEPYVVAADIYSIGNLAGRGGWSWYTGSAGWYYICYIKHILGINIKNGYLEMSPCVPKYWSEYSILYKFGSSIYNIKVKSEESSIKKKTFVNGILVDDDKVKLMDDGSVNDVEVIIRKVK